MQAKGPRPDLEQQYQGLTDKQRAIIDAHAREPDATNRDKAEAAGEELGEEINESYCSQVLNNKYPKLAHYRAELEHGDGEIATTQDATSGLSAGKEWQPISARPVGGEFNMEEAGSRTLPVTVEAESDGVSVFFEQRYLQELLATNQLPSELHERLLKAVMEQAFDS